MFNNSKHTTWYFQIIDRAKSETRSKGGSVYFEEHHIIPSALGGNDETSNLILLTAREHFIAHWLLIKMVSGRDRYKMACALNSMSNGQRERRQLGSRYYEIAKTIYRESMKGNKHCVGRKLSDETKAKISASRKNKTMSPETRRKITETNSKRKQSTETRKKIGDANRKTYTLISPTGDSVVVQNMVQFCELNGLSRSHMSSLCNGTYARKTYKGWSIPIN
ncbi:MobE homing endonuclease [Sinorhizobium phage phiN3]|uniref:MobE homing endonuclease n=1 Tax=Sinorhizobium phage phiN3 TaxID=1647405 RepID=A0A0F6WCJ7_9CAUD|nr:homing endonuclease [Sinorhizobium phage phiN3]AKF13320.1 MobE homing endonuclease [Sinorhizobium phage phiN3]